MVLHELLPAVAYVYQSQSQDRKSEKYISMEKLGINKNNSIIIISQKVVIILQGNKGHGGA